MYMYSVPMMWYDADLQRALSHNPPVAGRRFLVHHFLLGSRLCAPIVWVGEAPGTKIIDAQPDSPLSVHITSALTVTRNRMRQSKLRFIVASRGG